MKSRLFAGVDVGGSRKGFHLALIDDERVRACARERTVAAAVALLRSWGPQLAAVDAPVERGPRACERELARAVCRLYYAPRHPRGDFYEWMRRGLALYAALRGSAISVIECFPTATWTRLGGPRGQLSRASWSRAVLESSGLRGVAPSSSQDERDAIGAALTARLAVAGRVQRFGQIVVPLAPDVPREHLARRSLAAQSGC